LRGLTCVLTFIRVLYGTSLSVILSSLYCRSVNSLSLLSLRGPLTYHAIPDARRATPAVPPALYFAARLVLLLPGCTCLPCHGESEEKTPSPYSILLCVTTCYLYYLLAPPSRRTRALRQPPKMDHRTLPAMGAFLFCRTSHTYLFSLPTDIYRLLPTCLLHITWFYL